MKRVKCPHCQTVHQITPTDQSQRVECDWCHKAFRVRPSRPEVDSVDPLAELRAARERAVEEIRGRAPAEEDDFDDDEDVELDEAIERQGYNAGTEPTAEEMFAQRRADKEAQLPRPLAEPSPQGRPSVPLREQNSRSAIYQRMRAWSGFYVVLSFLWIVIGVFVSVAGVWAKITYVREVTGPDPGAPGTSLFFSGVGMVFVGLYFLSVSHAFEAIFTIGREVREIRSVD